MPLHPPPTQLAALDLGSNSFHLIISRFEGGEIRPVECLGEKVQLAKGMKNGKLAGDAIERAMACLARFEQRLRQTPREGIRVVGTKAMRQAKNSAVFIQRAEELLRVPVEIVSGREEARLVYLGVAESLATFHGRRLVIDIGGGSTELVIGCDREPQIMESLSMGCVTYTDQFFADGRLSVKRYKRARNSAAVDILNIKDNFVEQGWDVCLGSSGTLRAISKVLSEQGWCAEDTINREALERLEALLTGLDAIAEIKLPGLSESRQGIFAAGVAITSALFRELDIDAMQVAPGALREGVLFDMVSRFTDKDVRERTVQGLMTRFGIEANSAERVAAIASALYRQVEKDWQLGANEYDRILNWAARLHEIGLALSHSKFHKHGSYLLQYADLPGFSTSVQAAIAALVRGHRRKLSADIFADYDDGDIDALMKLTIILRLAVVLKHANVGMDVIEQSAKRRAVSADGKTQLQRKDVALDAVPAQRVPQGELPQMDVKAKGKNITLQFEKDWLDDHPLTLSQLEAEVDYLANVGYTLTYQ